MSDRQTETPDDSPHIAASGVIFRGDDVLLVKRGKAPRLGEWSLPGGRLRAGERLADTLARELIEETGVTAQIGPLVDAVEEIHDADPSAPKAGPQKTPAFHYVVLCHVGRWVAGDVRPGDDAAEARWAAPGDLGTFGLPSPVLALIERARPMAKRLE